MDDRITLVLSTEEVERILTAFCVCAEEGMLTKKDESLAAFLAHSIGILDEWLEDMTSIELC